MTRTALTLDDLAAAIATTATRSEPGPVFQTVATLAQKAIGHRLFTIMRVHHEVQEVERLYSSLPDAYPVSGRKPKQGTPLLDLQRQASAYAMAHPDEIAAMTVEKLGLNKDAVAKAVSNVELNWQMTPKMVDEVHAYADHMADMKQIRNLPDFATMLDPSFSETLAKHA
jgi:hypothetical protein